MSNRVNNRSASETEVNPPSQTDYVLEVEDSESIQECYRKLVRLLLPPEGDTRIEHMSRQISCVILPIILTFVLVIAFVKVFGLSVEGSRPFDIFMIRHYDSSKKFADNILAAVYNSGMVIVIVIIFTYAFMALYVHRMGKTLDLLMIISFGLLVAAFVAYLLLRLFAALDWPLDVFTWILASINFSSIVVVAIFREDFCTPMMNHSALILASIAIGWPFLCMDTYTLWITLVLLILWDAFAVLAPCGPLRHVAALHEYRTLMAEPMELPAGLFYQAKYYRLGLGDFVFYGVLVGRAALYDAITCVCCSVAILAGLCATVVVGAVLPQLQSSSQLVPALPLALGFGAVTFFWSRWTLVPFLESLGERYIAV